MPKPSVLPLYEVFNAIDKKDYGWYKSLSKEKQKAFSPYLQLKYSASATGSNELQEYMIRATNNELNINFWEVSKHPDLTYKILCQKHLLM